MRRTVSTSAGVCVGSAANRLNAHEVSLCSLQKMKSHHTVMRSTMVSRVETQGLRVLWRKLHHWISARVRTLTPSVTLQLLPPTTTCNTTPLAVALEQEKTSPWPARLAAGVCTRMLHSVGLTIGPALRICVDLGTSCVVSDACLSAPAQVG